MNSSWLIGSGSALQYLGLALLIGGMLALGAFTAPVLFKQFPRPEAGVAMTVIFRRYDMVILIAVLMVMLGEGLKVLTGQFHALSLLSGFRYGVLLLLVGLTLYSVLLVNPKIEQMQQAGVTHGATPEGKTFTQTHQLSEKLYKIELLAAVLLLILTSFSQRLP